MPKGMGGSLFMSKLEAIEADDVFFSMGGMTKAHSKMGDKAKGVSPRDTNQSPKEFQR